MNSLIPMFFGISNRKSNRPLPTHIRRCGGIREIRRNQEKGLPGKRLDRQIDTLLAEKRERLVAESKQLTEARKMWTLRKPILSVHIFALQEKTKTPERETGAVLMESMQKK